MPGRDIGGFQLDQLLRLRGVAEHEPAWYLRPARRERSARRPFRPRSRRRTERSPSTAPAPTRQVPHRSSCDRSGQIRPDIAGAIADAMTGDASESHREQHRPARASPWPAPPWRDWPPVRRGAFVRASLTFAADAGECVAGHNKGEYLPPSGCHVLSFRSCLLSSRRRSRRCSIATDQAGLRRRPQQTLSPAPFSIYYAPS